MTQINKLINLKKKKQKKNKKKQNKTKLYFNGFKSSRFVIVIGGFRSVLCVSVFPGSLLVIITMIDGSEKRTCEGGF